MESREGGKGFMFSIGNIFATNESKYSPSGTKMRDWYTGLKTSIETARRIFYLDHDLHTMHICDDI